MRIIDLSLILVNDSVGFIAEIRLVIPRLSQYHNLHILGTISTTLMLHHILLVAAILRALTNDDATRVASVAEVYCVSMLVNGDKSTSTETTIESSLSLKLFLDTKKTANYGLPNFLVLCLGRLIRGLLRGV